jgi:hypothetical protein
MPTSELQTLTGPRPKSASIFKLIESYRYAALCVGPAEAIKVGSRL